eukprot:COSAG04_NODE_872_length_9709_cov_20.683767_4_plen_311_part_00
MAELAACRMPRGCVGAAAPREQAPVVRQCCAVGAACGDAHGAPPPQPHDFLRQSLVVCLVGVADGVAVVVVHDHLLAVPEPELLPVVVPEREYGRPAGLPQHQRVLGSGGDELQGREQLRLEHEQHVLPALLRPLLHAPALLVRPHLPLRRALGRRAGPPAAARVLELAALLPEVACEALEGGELARAEAAAEAEEHVVGERVELHRSPATLPYAPRGVNVVGSVRVCRSSARWPMPAGVDRGLWLPAVLTWCTLCALAQRPATRAPLPPGRSGLDRFKHLALQSFHLGNQECFAHCAGSTFCSTYRAVS